MQAGRCASGWKLEDLFFSLHWLFHDTPARREDFTNVTGSTKFPLRFCKHPWLENLPVAERAQEVWPHIVKYVQSAQAKTVTCPHTKSFQTVCDCIADKLISCKMSFFISVAKQVQPFLV